MRSSLFCCDRWSIYYFVFRQKKKADNGSRTRDLNITNVALYHLSYISNLKTMAIIHYMKQKSKHYFICFKRYLKSLLKVFDVNVCL